MVIFGKIFYHFWHFFTMFYLFLPNFTKIYVKTLKNSTTISIIFLKNWPQLFLSKKTCQKISEINSISPTANKMFFFAHLILASFEPCLWQRKFTFYKKIMFLCVGFFLNRILFFFSKNTFILMFTLYRIFFDKLIVNEGSKMMILFD